MSEDDGERPCGKAEVAILFDCADALAGSDDGFDIRDARTLIDEACLTVMVPIGRGLEVPVKAYRSLQEYHLDGASTIGGRLAARISAIRSDRALIACATIRIGMEAERIAQELRSEGIEIMLKEVGVADAYADEMSPGLPGVALCFLHRNDDLGIASTTLLVSSVDNLRRTISDWRPRLRAIADAHELCARHAAKAVIDSVAVAAAEHFKVPGRDIRPRVMGEDEAGKMDVEDRGRHGRPEVVAFVWQAGTVLAKFRMSADVLWDCDRLVLRGGLLPETLIAAAAGRPLGDFVDHPVLRSATIDYASIEGDEIELIIKRSEDLLLHPCGTIAAQHPISRA